MGVRVVVGVGGSRERLKEFVGLSASGGGRGTVVLAGDLLAAYELDNNVAYELERTEGR